MLYTMFWFRPDEIVQVVSLHNSVFSGQPKVVHKFALNVANHFEFQKGERKTCKSKHFALAFSFQMKYFYFSSQNSVLLCS